ncbi:MAG TPA: nucleotide disphospho-sugar-binding domain-containing protein [Micromonosporaceae bacterium]
MARFLLSTMPSAGHVTPAQPLAAALVAAGHEVVWHTGAGRADLVAATGATLAPFDRTPTLEEVDPQESDGRRGLGAVNTMLRKLLVDRAAGQLADYQAILANFPADVVLADLCCLGAAMQHELGGPPWAVLNVTALTGVCPDEAPWGSGGQPATSAFARARNRAINWLGYHVALRPVTAAYNQVRREVGLPVLRPGRTVFDEVISPYLQLQPSTTAFEYPRSLPRQVHLVGPLLPPAPADFEPPPWWDEMLRAERVVHVTQGTTATDPRQLALPAIEALADSSALVVVTVPNASGWGALPANVRTADYVPYPLLLPHVDVMVTNAGYGGVHYALSAGVPIVAAGHTGDQPEVCARIAWTGAGIWLKTPQPTPGQLREAVTQVLTDPSYRRSAVRVQHDFAAAPGAPAAVDLLTRLAETRQSAAEVG